MLEGYDQRDFPGTVIPVLLLPVKGIGRCDGGRRERFLVKHLHMLV